MKMIKSGVTKGTPSRLPFGAGVYFAGVTYNENTAPTEEEIASKLLGATADGGTLTITPEFFIPDLDGVTVAVKELQQKVGETASMETSIAELTSENVAKTVIGQMNESTDGNYEVITSSDLTEGHFYSGFGYLGHLLDGRPVIIIFKNALCTSGLSLSPKNKTNSTFKGTFECQSDIEYGIDKLPYAIFVHKEDGWSKENVETISGLDQTDPLDQTE